MLDILNQDVVPALALPLGEIEAAFRRLTRVVQEMDQAPWTTGARTAR